MFIETFRAEEMDSVVDVVQRAGKRKNRYAALLFLALVTINYSASQPHSKTGGKTC